MSEEWIVCRADIRNKMQEAGIFRQDEKIVLTTKGCVIETLYGEGIQLPHGGSTYFKGKTAVFKAHTTK